MQNENLKEIIVNSTNLQNNFGKYLQLMTDGYTILIMKNGKNIGKMVPKDQKEKPISQYLKGILAGYPDVDYKDIRVEKYFDNK